MLLNIPIQDLLSSQLDITLDSDGRLSCRVKPNPRHNLSHAALPSGITLNLETENGHVLSLYASIDETSAVDSPPFDASAPEFSHISPVEHHISYPYADASPPPDYFSPCDATSPDSTGSNNGYFSVNEHDREGEHYDFRYGVPAEMESNQYPPTMGIVPSQVVAPSEPRLLSPLSFHATAPAFSASASPSPSASLSSFSESTTLISPVDIPTPPPREVEPHAGSTTSKTGRRAQYPCLHPSCDRMLTSPYTRQVHMGTHKAKVRKAFLCTLGCGEAFTRQHDRQRHEVALHGKQCKHVCQRCKRFFSSAKMLDRHVCRGHRQGAVQWPLTEVETQNANNFIPDRFQ
ncbi:hypothetical protein FB45DRAFT_137638 [Roridomyces roridus]|uniref:C2H2-type domain-containing protein n=1 Tax=Roridomyces roridus TaxID=1738132 RepID=A0AAD7BHF6_9AGAR|nr:hypothetical protein FB45DRAFT_137638 [Roridomyces roridus]